MPRSPTYAPDLPSLLLRVLHDEPEEAYGAWGQLRDTLRQAGGDKNESSSSLESCVSGLCPTATETASLVQALCTGIGHEVTRSAPLQVAGTLLGVEVFCSRCPGVRQPNLCWAVHHRFKFVTSPSAPLCSQLLSGDNWPAEDERRALLAAVLGVVLTVGGDWVRRCIVQPDLPQTLLCNKLCRSAQYEYCALITTGRRRGPAAGAVAGAPSSALRASTALCAWVGARARARAAPAADRQQPLDPDRGAACCGSRGKPRAAAARAHGRLDGAGRRVGAPDVATAVRAASRAQLQRAQPCS